MEVEENYERRKREKEGSATEDRNRSERKKKYRQSKSELSTTRQERKEEITGKKTMKKGDK